ncbi:MAG: DUF721 domain-containing protein [Bryobacteraceae bacterium]
MERAGRLISRLKLPEGILTPEDLARAAWPVAVGKRIAAHTKVAGVVRTTVIIEVEDVLWQRNLNTLRKFILVNLRGALGPGIVDDVEFRPMIPRRQAQRAEAPRQLKDDADGIADPFLRRSYKSSRKRATA